MSSPEHGDSPTLDDLLSTWDGRRNRAFGDARGPFLRTVLDRIADGEPATVADIAEATGWDRDTVSRQMDAAAAAGCEIRDGAVVGAALTLTPTDHEFTVRGNTLHTWCGFDALFLPPLLGEPAHVRSTCPVTGQPIALAVDPAGTVHDVAPVTTCVAITGPAAACATAGPGSELCAQMPFLASPEAGRAWADDHAGVAVVDLATAMTVATAYAGTRREPQAEPGSP